MGWLIEEKPQALACIRCHRAYTMAIPHLRWAGKFWRSAVKFCPFCGCKTDVSEESLATEGYVEVTKDAVS